MDNTLVFNPSFEVLYHPMPQQGYFIYLFLKFITNVGSTRQATYVTIPPSGLKCMYKSFNLEQ